MTRERSGGARQVLVVDDDRDIRDAMRDLLEGEGYRVVCVCNGLEALHHLRNASEPCVVLLDHMMPVMDGQQFRAEQLTDPAIASVPVVVITAGAGVPIAGTDFVRKPIDVDRLLALLSRHANLART